MLFRSAAIDTCNDPSKVFIYDLFSAVAAPDGYWSWIEGDYLTGTVQNTFSPTSLTFDTDLSFAPNQDLGLVGVFTSGAMLGKVFNIRFSATNSGNHQLTLQQAMDQAPAVGDSLRVYLDNGAAPVCWQNPHFSAAGHMMAARAISPDMFI